MPVAVWRETIEHYYPNTGWVALRAETLERSSARAVAAGCATTTPASQRLLGEPAMPDQLEQLVDSLLYEGYALYPYTPRPPRTPPRRRSGSSTRPRYAAALAEHLRPPRAALRLPRPRRRGSSPRCGSSPQAGDRHRGRRTACLGRTRAVGTLAASSWSAHAPPSSETRSDGARSVAAASHCPPGRPSGGTLRSGRSGSRTARPCAPGLDRPDALARSLVSTHPMLRDRRRAVPLAARAPCASAQHLPGAGE